MKPILYHLLVLIALGTALAQRAECCDHCARCGCESDCCKTCRLVCETKKVPKITYSCKCEDFCVPGPSEHSISCDECGKKKHIYTPTCAEVRTRKVLVKHETMEEVPSHKWVVENVCAACAEKCDAENAAVQQKLAAAKGQPGGHPLSFESAPAAAQPQSASSPADNSTAARLGRALGPIFGQK